MNRASIAERLVFFAIALAAIGIMWNAFKPDYTAKLATIVFPAETVCYAVDYGKKDGVHARGIDFDGRFTAPLFSVEKESLTVGELSGINPF